MSALRMQFSREVILQVVAVLLLKIRVTIMLLVDSMLLTVATNMGHMFNHKGLETWTIYVISKVLIAMLENKRTKPK